MRGSDYQFDFEKLIVYQKSLKFTDYIFRITVKFQPEFKYSLGDQFRRAALSICNNIAEGSRKTSKSRRHFYGYSLDSARECIPMISLANMQSLITNDERDELREQCLYICNMLGRLIKSTF